MGIYPSENIYGIQIYNFIDEIINTLYEKKYDVIMNKDQMNEAFLYYLEIEDKSNIRFKIYTECSSTFELNKNKNFMMWFPLSLNQFIEIFGYL
jgi:hypothetical protein